MAKISNRLLKNAEHGYSSKKIKTYKWVGGYSILVNYQSLLSSFLSSFVSLARSASNYYSLKYTRNRLPLVSFTDLGFYDLPACKYETKILPFISTFYIAHFCKQFNQVFPLLTSYATF